MISVASPEDNGAEGASGQLPHGTSRLIYRGRAVAELSPRAPAVHPWQSFTECPYEDLREPGRVHVDPMGEVHVCQGISIGNVFRDSLARICERYDPDAHPVIGPLLAGGPAELARRYGLSPRGSAGDSRYADACHLCYETRLALRQRFPEILAPDQMYGAFEDEGE